MFEFQLFGFQVDAMASLAADSGVYRRCTEDVCCVIKPEGSVALEATDGRYVAAVLKNAAHYANGTPPHTEVRLPLSKFSGIRAKKYYHVEVDPFSYKVFDAVGSCTEGPLPVIIDGQLYSFPDFWTCGLIAPPGTEARGGTAFIDCAVQYKLLKAANKFNSAKSLKFLSDAFHLWFNGPDSPVRFQLKSHPDFFGVAMYRECVTTSRVWREKEFPQGEGDNA